MFVTLLGTFLGLLLGLLAAGPLGGVLGLIIGTAAGMLWVGSRAAARPIPPGTEVVREQQELICETKGRVATAEFVRDAKDGTWLDVERCSLCTPENEVQCAKRCLMLIRGVLPARSHPVGNQAGAG